MLLIKLLVCLLFGHKVKKQECVMFGLNDRIVDTCQRCKFVVETKRTVSTGPIIISMQTEKNDVYTIDV